MISNRSFIFGCKARRAFAARSLSAYWPARIMTNCLLLALIYRALAPGSKSLSSSINSLAALGFIGGPMRKPKGLMVPGIDNRSDSVR